MHVWYHWGFHWLLLLLPGRLWRKGRYCQLCWRCYGNKPDEEDGLINCSVCDKWMHAGTNLGYHNLISYTVLKAYLQDIH